MSLVAFDHIPICESREPLVELAAFPFLKLPVYALNGWTKTHDMFARVGLLDKLARVQQKHLDSKGWQWVVYDAWRPRTVQATIYQHYWREMSHTAPTASLQDLERRVRTYVSLPANPDRVPPHSTGGAIDVGFWDKYAGALVPMGSDFDEFCPQAANAYFETVESGEDLAVRRRDLTSWLAEEGIGSDVDEWFHKDWGSQKWAAQSGSPQASYGEVLNCSGDGRHVQVSWGADEVPELKITRVSGLATELDLSHPARHGAAQLPTPQDWLKAAT